MTLKRKVEVWQIRALGGGYYEISKQTKVRVVHHLGTAYTLDGAKKFAEQWGLKVEGWIEAGDKIVQRKDVI